MPVWGLARVPSIVLLATLAVLCLGDLAHAAMHVDPAVAECATDMACGGDTLCSATTSSAGSSSPVAVFRTVPVPATPTIIAHRPVGPSPDLPDRPPLVARGSRSPPLA